MTDKQATNWINANAPFQVRWWIHDRLRASGSVDSSDFQVNNKTMPKLINHNETEYDFALVFRDTPAPKIGGEISHGTRDDNGQVIYFAGSAYVVALANDFSKRETTAFVKIFPTIPTK